MEHAVPDRLPPPGPSFVRELEVRAGDRLLKAGMSRPSVGPDEWWLTVFWIADAAGVVSFRDLAPAAGPPPDPPVARLGPSIAGALSGFLLEENGRLGIRMIPVAQPADAARPWQAPAAVRAAFKWEPARAATLRPNELAETALVAFRTAIEALGRRGG